MYLKTTTNFQIIPVRIIDDDNNNRQQNLVKRFFLAYQYSANEEGYLFAKEITFEIKLKNDKICNATLAFTDEKCKEILENKENYIGKMATVCYFGVTNDGLLRFPIVKAIDRQSYE